MAKTDPVSAEELFTFLDETAYEVSLRAREIAERLGKTVDRAPEITSHHLQMARTTAERFADLYNNVTIIVGHQLTRAELAKAFTGAAK